MLTSKLTTKAQTTLPQPVRRALRLHPGDQVRYEIEGDRVVLSKVGAANVDDPFATFAQWDSDEDRHAYEKL